MVDQNLVDRELCLEALRRGLVSKDALVPFAQRKRAEPHRSLTGLLIEGGVLTPELGTELERLARERVLALAHAPAPPPPAPPRPAGNGREGSGRVAAQPPKHDSGKQNVGTTGKHDSGKQNIGTISGKHNKLQMPQKTILDLDMDMPSAEEPKAPAKASAPPPRLKPGDSKNPEVAPESFRASSTYVDSEAKIPDGGRTMLEEDFEAPPDPKAMRTMLVDDGFQVPPEPRSPHPIHVQRTMIAEDGFDAHAAPAATGAPSDAPENVGAPAGTPTPAKTAPPAGSSTDAKRAVAGSSPGRNAPPQAPMRRGPRDLGEPKIAVGGIFGDYEVLSTLGEGAMGQVFRAKHRPSDTIVALKVMRGGLVSNPKVRERFLREAKAAKLMDHVNVVRFIDAGMIGNDQFLAMEFVEGRSLQALLSERRGKPLEFEKASDFFRQICSGLAAAHEAGVIHRDLKPENILLTKDGETAKITDFGLARREEESMLLTRPGQVMGSPYYMAPEQGMGLAVDHRADIYSLGNIIFCLFTGRVPFPFPSATEVIHAHCQAERPDPREVNPDVPPGLAAFILKMLEREADKRHQTAKQALSEFEEIYEKEISPSLVPSRSQIPADAMSDSDDSGDEIFTGQKVFDAFPPGTRIGSLTIQGTVGAGGMGAVYKAVHDEGRTSALKILPAELAKDRKRFEAFLREGELGARITHPNVVDTREYGNDAVVGVAYIEQELVEGTSLDSMIKTGVVQDEALLVNIARGMAKALEAVHAAGIVHRDVKPQNILLGGEFLASQDANVKLIDFGLAVEKNDIPNLPKGQFAGTPIYMSPEQGAADGVVDERSDLYSLGATLYHAACAHPPFEGKSPQAIAYQHQRSTAKPARELNPSISEAFEILIQLLLAKNPDERFQSAKELLTELTRTTPDGRLAKPQVHAKYRTNRLGKKGEILKLEHNEPPPPPPKSAIIAASAIVFLCLAAILYQVGHSIYHSMSSSVPSPSPEVVVPQPTASVEAMPSPTPSPKDTLSEQAKRDWREKTIKQIEQLLKEQKFLEVRTLTDSAVHQDGTIENRIQRVRAQLDGVVTQFDSDLFEARRLGLAKNWKEAQDKLDEAELFLSRDDDRERIDRIKTEINDMKRRPGR